jgi:hypothetical protein
VDGNYFTAAEYEGGYDEINIQKPPGTKAWIAHLYYQTTSKEYVTFLRDEINGSSSNPLTSPTPSGENQAYIAQSDPYFVDLKDWGDGIWDLWLHNDGAPPEIMTTSIGKHMPPHAHVEPDGVHLNFPSLPNAHYQVQSSLDLKEGSWSDIGESMEGNGTVLTFVDPDFPATGKAFYRLVITYDND